MGVNGIYGLSGSGLDVESMVKMGMMAKKNQLAKMQQTYTKKEWTKEAYLELYDKLQDYNTSTLSTYKMSNTMNARSATSSDPSIKVTASSSAPTGSHVITVENTATSAYLNGTKKLDRANDASKYSTALKDSMFQSVSYTESNSTYTFTSWDGKETKISADDLSKKTALSFCVGADTDTGITQTAQYASADISSSAFSNTNLFKTAIASYLSTNTTDGWSGATLTSITDNGNGTLTFIGTKAGNEVKTENYNASDVALSISFSDGKTLSSANITFGDLATILNKDGATFQDFVDLLNKKFQGENNRGQTVNLKADFDAVTNKFSISNTEADSSAKVRFQITDTAVGHDLNDIIHNGLTSVSTGRDGNNEVVYDKIVDEDDPDEPSINTLTFTANDGQAVTTDSSSMKQVYFTYKDIIDGASYYDLVNKVNAGGTNVRAYYDSAQDTFSFYNLKTGSNNSVVLLAETNDGTYTKNAEYLLDSMGLKATNGGADLTNEKPIDFTTGTAYSTSGKDASVLIDGTRYDKIDSNSLNVKGVTYNFASVTEKTTATVTVEQDVDKIVDNVKSFVKEYNELMEKLYTAYNEKPNSSYAPLTEEQKSEMTEEQIKKWEEKAKSGLLYHDSTVRRIIEQMRNAVSGTIGALDSNYKYNTAYSIGISTKGIQGQLTLDEDKLRAALVDDPDSVYKVFGTLDSTKSDAADSANGIAQRIGGVLSKATKSISTISGKSSDINEDSTLNNLLRNLQTKMSNFQKLMNAFENALYKKYDAMESSLAMLGSQLNYVTSAFSS